MLPVCQPRSSHPGLHIVGKPLPNLIVQHAWPSVRKAPKHPPVIGALAADEVSRRCHIPDVPIPCPTSPGEQGKPLKLLRIVVGHWVITRVGMVHSLRSPAWGHTAKTVPAGSRVRCPTKPFFGAHEVRLKRSCTPMVSDQTMESTMLDIIISLFYRQSCKASLSAIRFQMHLWD